MNNHYSHLVPRSVRAARKGEKTGLFSLRWAARSESGARCRLSLARLAGRLALRNRAAVGVPLACWPRAELVPSSARFDELLDGICRVVSPAVVFFLLSQLLMCERKVGSETLSLESNHKKLLLTVDHSARPSMKNAANCENQCELQEP